jgi:hypothetical protein
MFVRGVDCASFYYFSIGLWKCSGSVICFCFAFYYIIGLVWFMVLNATFYNISVMSWWSVLLVEEDGVPEENHRHVASY